MFRFKLTQATKKKLIYLDFQIQLHIVACDYTFQIIFTYLKTEQSLFGE